MTNTDLQQTYEQMHTTGKSAWFDDGQAEREAIFKLGETWAGKSVLEIGCGEGDLCAMMQHAGARVVGIDYSGRAIERAWGKHPQLELHKYHYRGWTGKHDVIVMQGVLEHLDDPFSELRWMIDNFKPQTVITSSPAFLNPRGLIWHTLDMLGAVMSKTDLHYLNPWDFRNFCHVNDYELQYKSIEHDWGGGSKMIEDLKKRIPLALKDGGISYDERRLRRYFQWLDEAKGYMPARLGAVIVYRIDL